MFYNIYSFSTQQSSIKLMHKLEIYFSKVKNVNYSISMTVANLVINFLPGLLGFA